MGDRGPWTFRTNEGKLKTFQEGKWTDLPDGDFLRLNKSQAQVWLTLYNMIMEPNMRQKYEINSHRKNVIVDLRKHFNAVLIDQLPVLGDLQRTVEELNMMAAPEAAQQSFFVLEQVCTMREGLLKQDWEEVVKYLREVF